MSIFIAGNPASGFNPGVIFGIMGISIPCLGLPQVSVPFTLMIPLRNLLDNRLAVAGMRTMFVEAHWRASKHDDLYKYNKIIILPFRHRSYFTLVLQIINLVVFYALQRMGFMLNIFCGCSFSRTGVNEGSAANLVDGI
jgi:hypothetical protein